MARFLADRFAQGASPGTLKLAVAAVRWFARKTGRPSSAGERTRDTLKRLAEDGADRGRGQASPLTYDEAIRIVALAKKPIDGAIVACLFMAGMRRSEVAALEWRDIEEGTDGTLQIRVRTSKTNRDGAETDIRLVKNGFAEALRTMRPADAAPEARVFGGRDPQTISRRFQRAAKAAGITRKLSAHSGRIGLASEFTARGASEQEVMLAGAWKTSRMVAHYSAGARAERGGGREVPVAGSAHHDWIHHARLGWRPCGSSPARALRTGRPDPPAGHRRLGARVPERPKQAARRMKGMCDPRRLVLRMVRS